MAQPTDLGDILLDAAHALESAATRFPVERTGQRAPISALVRLCVLKRDNFRCDWCGNDYPGQLFNLDHIVPWSAGGSDDTTNLRLLCPGCNELRSNYRTDADYVRRMACTAMCMDCFGWDVTRADFDTDEIEHVFCGTCNRVSWIAKNTAHWRCHKL